LSNFSLAQIFPPIVKKSKTSWDAQAEINGYYLFIDGLRRSEDAKSPVFITTNFYDLNFAGVTTRKVYQIKIAATNIIGLGQVSQTVSWTNQFPNYPTGFKKDSNGGVYWTQLTSQNISAYKIYYKTLVGSYSRDSFIRVPFPTTNYNASSLVKPIYLTISAEDIYGNESSAQNQLILR
jgi:hypothetical protein